MSKARYYSGASYFPTNLGLQGDHQRSNAALALSMCRFAAEMSSQRGSFKFRPPCAIPEEGLARALEKAFWPGRCHTVTLPSSGDGDDADGNRIEVLMNLRCDDADQHVETEGPIATGSEEV